MTAPTAAVPPFLLRGVARLIDLGLQMFIMDAAFRVSAFLPEQGLVTVAESALLWVDLGVGLGALWIYTSLAEGLGGATLGKLCTGLRVVRADTLEPIGLKPALIRNLLFFIDGLFFGLVAYSSIMRSTTGQRLGDEVAGTRVVWRSEAPARNPWVGWPVGMIVALGLVVASYLLAT